MEQTSHQYIDTKILDLPDDLENKLTIELGGISAFHVIERMKLFGVGPNLVNTRYKRRRKEQQNGPNFMLGSISSP